MVCFRACKVRKKVFVFEFVRLICVTKVDPDNRIDLVFACDFLLARRADILSFLVGGPGSLGVTKSLYSSS